MAAEKKKQQQQSIGCLVLLIILAAVLIPAIQKDQEAHAAREQARANATTPQQKLRLIAEDTVSGNVIDVAYNEGQAVVVDFEMAQGLNGYSVETTNRQMAQMACTIRDDLRITNVRYQFVAKINVVDAYGNVDSANGIALRLTAQVIAQLNCENWGQINLAAIAEVYALHKLLQ